MMQLTYQTGCFVYLLVSFISPLYNKYIEFSSIFKGKPNFLRSLFYNIYINYCQISSYSYVSIPTTLTAKYPETPRNNRL